MQRQFLTDDLNFQGHHIVDWRWLNDIPTSDASAGQALVFDGTDVVWATLTATGFISVDWDAIINKPDLFPPSSHTHPWGEVTGKPTFVNSVTAGNGISVSATTGLNVEIADSYHIDTFEPNGFVNTDDSTWSFPGTRTFQIEAVSPTDGYDVYVKGVKFHKTTTESITFPDTEGIHAFYFDDTGTLNTTLTPLSGDIFTERALIAICRYNATDNSVIYQGEERHGITMDGRTHQYLHDTEGTRYVSGMALGNITADGDGSSIDHVTMQVGSGTIADEDLFLRALATANPYADWTVFSKTDTGRWIATSCGSAPIKSTAGVTATYNLLSGTTWSASQLTNNQYLLAHIFRTNSPSEPFIAIQGENVYGNQAAARAGATEELLALYTTGMPFVEFSPLGSVIYQYSSAYGNSYNLRIRSTDTGDDYVDWRQQNLQAASGGPTDHGSMGGLTDPDHPTTALQQTGAVTNNLLEWDGTGWNPTGSINVTNISASGNLDITGSGAIGGNFYVDNAIIASYGDADGQPEMNINKRGFNINMAAEAGPWARGYYFYDGSSILAGFYGFSTVNGTVIERMGMALDYNNTKGIHLLTDSGSVGIGTLAPGFKLDVNGVVNANTVQSEGNAYVNHNGPDGDSYLYFYDSSSPTGKHLRWDDSPGRFEFNGGLFVDGNLQTDNSLLANSNIYINYDGPDGTSALYFYEDSSPTGASLQFVDGDNEFKMNHRLRLDSGTDNLPLALVSTDANVQIQMVDTGGYVNITQASSALYIQPQGASGFAVFSDKDCNCYSDLSVDGDLTGDGNIIALGELHDRLRDVLTADVTKTNTAPTATGLSCTVASNAYYSFRSILFTQGSSSLSPNMDIRPTYPTGSTVLFTANVTAGGNSPVTTRVELEVDGINELQHSIEGIFYTGSTAGSFGYNFNLVGAGGNASLLRGSTLELTRLDQP